MAAINVVNPNAERTRQAAALAINVSASRGLADVLKTNLGECTRGPPVCFLWRGSTQSSVSTHPRSTKQYYKLLN